MARPRRDARPQPTEEALLDAAAVTFGALGYDEARLEDIAKQAGITRASLLYHFPSKEALYAAAVKRAFAEMSGTLERALSTEGDFERRLTNIVKALIEFGEGHLPLLSVVLRGCLRADDAVTRAELDRAFMPIIDQLVTAIRAAAGEQLPKRFPVRAAVLQLVFAHLVHAVMGPLGRTLWQGEAQTLQLAKLLFLVRPQTKEQR